VALTVVIVAVGAAFGGYLLRRRPSRWPAIAVLASAALFVPTAASSAASVSPHHHTNATTRPEVLDARASPWELSAKGGWTTVVGKVRFASACHLVALDWHHSDLPLQHCSAGRFSERLWLAPNKGHVAEAQAFELVASGKGTAKGEFFVRLAPAPAVMVTTTTVATTTSAATTAPVTSGLTTGPVPVLPTGPPPVPPSGTTTTTTAPTTTTTATTTTAAQTTTSTTTSGATNFTLAWSSGSLNDVGGPIAESSPTLATLDSTGPAVVAGDRTGYLYAYHLADGSPVAGWPVYDGGAPIDSTPSVAALNGGNLGSVFVGAGNAQYPATGGYEAYGPVGNQLWHTTVQNPPTDKNPAGGVQASLTVGDLQGGTDLFAGSLGQEGYALTATSGSVLAGWPFFTADSVFSTGAVGDLYGSGQEELVVGGASTQGVAYGLQYQNGGHVRVLDAQGQLIYDYDTNQEVDSSPAVGPFLAGGATGIVVGTGYYYAGASDTDKVLAFNARLVPAWSQTLDGCTESSPALVEINGQPDVVEGTDQGPVNCGGTNAGSVWVLDGQDGTPLCHTPVASRVIGSVVAADLAGDGQPDLLVPTIHGVEVLTDTCQEVTVLGPDLGFQNSPLVTDDPNGTIGITIAGYNGNNQGVVQHYEVPGSDGALAAAAGSWPMFHHDTSLTGVSSPLPDLGTVTPVDVTAQAGNAQVSLSWTAPSGGAGPASGYNVYEGTAPGHEPSTPVNGTSPLTSTAYTVSGLSNGTNYYFEVTAVNSAGEGAPVQVSAAPTLSSTTTT
jgi:hypothetical protein